MRLLFEMDKKDYEYCTHRFVRNSARSIIIRDGKIAMIHSLKYDYYKFPGGGIENGENPVEAMIRETREEAGLVVKPETVKEYGYVHRIDEIRGLLDADNDTIFKAFSAKIKEQEDRLQKTREIRQSYLSEVQRMKEKVKEFRETVLSLMEDYDPTEEFGITADEYREIVDSLTTYLDTHEFTEGDFDYDLSDDGDAAREEPEYLNVLNNPDFEVIYEQHGWEHAREVIGKFTVPDDGKEYMLLFTISKDKENPTAFANTALSVMLGANLKSRERTCQNSQKLGCNVTVSEDGQNHFWLLKRK